MEEEDYKSVYSELVKEKDNIEGLIAYGIYKRQKKEYIIQRGQEVHEQENRELTREDSNRFATEFVTFSMIPTQLEHYRSQAKKILELHFKQMTEQKRKDMVRELIQGDNKKIMEELRVIKGSLPSTLKSFLMGTLASVLATIIFAILAVVIYVYVDTSDSSMRQRAKDLIERKAEHSPTVDEVESLNYKNK